MDEEDITNPGWMALLDQTRTGFLPTVRNALIILANDEWLTGSLHFDAFADEPALIRPPPPAEDGGTPLPGPYPRPWDGDDVCLLQAYLQHAYSPRFTAVTAEQAMRVVARLNSFHPVVDWLAVLRWDGKPRLDNWIVNTFDPRVGELGAEARAAYHRAVGARLLIAAVRRIRAPGTKFDYLVIFEGPQGIGKSTVLRRLFGTAWFSDSLHSDLKNRDAAIGLLGKWCVELAEIEHVIRSDPETLKSFLSRQIDDYRPPYGGRNVLRPRQGVLIGTTNSDSYLRDVTGNRRIWPVRCQSADEHWIEVNRDQLWAEAAAREARGELIWMQEEELQIEAVAAAEERMVLDVWHHAIEDWLAMRRASDVIVADVLEHAIGMPKERMNRNAEMRAAGVLRMLGWERKLTRFDGRVIRAWRMPEADPLA